MRGTVLFWHAHSERDGGYGFIVPEGDGPNIRAGNYWFGPKALDGLTVRSGDKVEFSVGNYRPKKGPVANHVRLLCDDEQITTLAGELET